MNFDNLFQIINLPFPNNIEEQTDKKTRETRLIYNLHRYRPTCKNQDNHWKHFYRHCWSVNSVLSKHAQTCLTQLKCKTNLRFSWMSNWIQQLQDNNSTLSCYTDHQLFWSTLSMPGHTHLKRVWLIWSFHGCLTQSLNSFM